MAERQSKRERVAVKVGERFLLVQAEEIIYASLTDDSINIVTSQLAGTSNFRTLDELQSRLDPSVFWRVHRSHLVNINKVKEIVPWFSRNYILRMKDAKAHGDPGQPRSDQAAAGVSPPLESRIQLELRRGRADAPGNGAGHGGRCRGSRGSPVIVTVPAGSDPAVRSKTAERLRMVRDELVAWFKTLASAAVYATLIVTFGFQVARVEGMSMAPTLEDQDRLIVNKLAYRIGEPHHGDIVMLYYPIDPNKSFVKRVVAEEGDTVRIVDGNVFVNETPMKDDFVPEDYRAHDDWGPQVIPEGYYFVLGDHRNNSSDSRHWGFVPKRYIIGKVQVRWWPIPTARVF